MIVLDDPQLGELELRSDPYTVASFQIGSRSTRAVIRDRAVADGIFDDTKYGGGRAVTIAIMLNEHSCAVTPSTMQELFDRLLPYMAPRRRPTMRWSLPGSDGDVREMVVRGADAPVQINAPKHPVITCQFIGDGEITSPDEECTVINPALDVEQGRTYDRSGDRVYPASLSVGARLIEQGGNERAHWRGAIYGSLVNPYIEINGVRVDFLSNTGLVLPAGTSVVIDTKQRTMFLNGDIASSRFDRTNFTDWQWEDLMLQPGDNLVRFGAATVGVGAQMNLCWKRSWAG